MNPTLKPWWQNMVARAENESDLFVSVDQLGHLMELLTEATKLKRSVIVNNLYSGLARKTVCYAGCALKLFRGVLAWKQLDKVLDKEFPKTFFTRKDSGSTVYEQINRRIRITAEIDMTISFYRQLNDIPYLSKYLAKNTNVERMYDCMSNVLIMEQLDQMPSSMHNLKTIFILFFAFNLLAYLVLCVECIQK